MSLSRHTCQISLASSYFPASSSLYFLACTPTFGKVGVQFFSLAPLANPVLYPHLKIRGAAHELKEREPLNCRDYTVFRE